jgi:hypothetical protein
MRRVFLLLGPLLALLAWQFPLGSQSDVDAGTALRLDVPELAQRAELVLEGRVQSATALVGASGLIETEYRIHVQRTFEGEHQDSRDVRLPGGVLPNGNGLMLPGMPTLWPGEDVILFLTGPSSSGVRMPVGLSQGKFRVETNLSGQKQVSRRHGSLSVVDPDTGMLIESKGNEVFGYAAIIAEIHAGLSGAPGESR